VVLGFQILELNLAGTAAAVSLLYGKTATFAVG
jgi:hypothetical protein